MDENFTTKADSFYLASITQEKKIIYLERQLRNSELYSKTLEKSLQATKSTMQSLIKNQPHREVLARYTDNLYKLQKRVKEIQLQMKESNAKLLIEMQLRIQEKTEYLQKVSDLQETIVELRKSNKDKENQFTVIVNKLRKYEDIREMTLEQKITKQDSLNLAITNRYKQELIKEMAQEINRYKKFYQSSKKQVDKKLRVLEFALQSGQNYENLKQAFAKKLSNPKSNKSNERSQQSISLKKKSSVFKLNGTNIELVKQIKRLVINNRLLEECLNESIQKNQQLLLNNQILLRANLNLQQRLKQYRNMRLQYVSPTSRSSQQSSNSGMNKMQKRNSEVLLLKSSSELSSNGFNNNRDSQPNLSVKDDLWLYKIEYDAEEARLKNYLQKLKSEDYQINVNDLNYDVGKISQFLLLSLQKQGRNQSKQDFSTKHGVRSLSASTKGAQKKDSAEDDLQIEDV